MRRTTARVLSLLGILSLIALVASVLLGLWVARIASQAPTIRELSATRLPEPSVVLSANGEVLTRFQQNRREPVKLAEISPHVVQALIATEDRRFREHIGIDWRSLARAVVKTSTGKVQGGSTITQQLARNLYPDEIGRARSIERKVKETVTALRLERLYTKDQILEAYLNTVPFLYNTVGIGAAARTYFDKPASDLDVLESATLVGMLKGTYYFNPVQHPQRAVARRNLVLSQMARQGLLPPAEVQALGNEPLHLNFNPVDETPRLAPHFTAHVRRWLNEWAELHDVDLETDGLVIHTTLDTRLQEAAMQAIDRQTAALQKVADVEWSRATTPLQSHATEAYVVAARRLPAFEHFWRTHPELLSDALRKTEAYAALRRAGRDDPAAMAALIKDGKIVDKVRATKTRLEAGFVAIDPTTGAVRAWVGSRDHRIDQFDHVSQALRQPGSTFKPIVYAAALEKGIQPSRTYMDTPIDIQLGEGKVWRPTDMSGSSDEPLTMWEGLVYSKNTITAQVMLDAGLDNIATLARAMGVTDSKLDKVPSMALGTSPVTLLEMATVYATIANEGRHRPPYVVERITDRQGRVITEFGAQPGKQALSLDTHHKLIDMMRGVVRQGTGSMLRSRFAKDLDLAGKTGTTQRNMDAWFMAMHPRLVAGAWLGFNDQRVTMRGRYWGQGGHSALLIVGDFFQQAAKQGTVDQKVAFATPIQPPPMSAFDWAQAMNDGDESLAPGGGMPADDAASDATTIQELRTSQPWDAEDAPRSAEELGEVMRAMGRDPETGRQLEPALPP
jgi:penicillin-binding protein 1A